MKKLTSIVIRDQKTHDGGTDALEAKIQPTGAVLLEGYDSGQGVKEAMGDWDYEFWITVAPEYKDTLILHLLKERFAAARDMKSWLEEKQIPFEFSSYA